MKKIFLVHKIREVFLGFALTLIVTEQAAFASVGSTNHPWRSQDMRPGYTEKVDPESENTGEILYSVENPYAHEVLLSERIFDPQLKKDITTRYQEQFGRNSAEIVYNRTPYLNTNFSEGASITFSEEEYQDQQKKFGNYIAKRLVEYHFEKEAKNNPDLKGVYQAKQTIENASASIGKVKLRARYRISSNSILAYVKNPYADLQARFELSGGKEVVYSVSKDIGSGYSALTEYYAEKPRWDIIARKALTNALVLSVTYSPFKTIDVEDGFGGLKEIKEEIGLAGLSYSF